MELAGRLPLDFTDELSSNRFKDGDISPRVLDSDFFLGDFNPVLLLTPVHSKTESESTVIQLHPLYYH